MTALSFPVDDTLAAAYTSASPEEQERLARVAAVLFRVSLLDRRTPSQRLQDTADRLGEEARANGWTDEMTEGLLRGDFDDDE